MSLVVFLARAGLGSRRSCDELIRSGVVTVKPPRRGQELGPDGKVRIFVFIYTKAFGELWIDDVTLVPIAASPGTR